VPNYRPVFNRPLEEVPFPTQKRLLTSLSEIAELLSGMRSDSVDSMAAAELLLYLDGWRFHYHVDPPRECLRLHAAFPLGC
jgi:hypothetical protein